MDGWKTTTSYFQVQAVSFREGIETCMPLVNNTIVGFLRGGCSRGGGNWGTLRIFREDWGTLGNIREY